MRKYWNIQVCCCFYLLNSRESPPKQSHMQSMYGVTYLHVEQLDWEHADVCWQIHTIAGASQYRKGDVQNWPNLEAAWKLWFHNLKARASITRCLRASRHSVTHGLADVPSSIFLTFPRGFKGMEIIYQDHPRSVIIYGLCDWPVNRM